jgi:predicted XRE-type DNA-binding protein
MVKELPQAERIKEDLFLLIEKTMKWDNVSQAEVARRIGAQRYNINKVMRRKESVSIEFLLNMAESLDLELELTKWRKT